MSNEQQMMDAPVLAEDSAAGLQVRSVKGVKVAVVGCGHGELDKMYETLAYMEKQNGFKVELLLVCGDFQAVRNEPDLATMACPPKYRAMNTFYKYYSGECKAPVLTLFIGGNHEASNYLLELFHGGWVAPNIYFLGFCGVVRFAGLTIAGLSGIYKSGDFRKGHHECPPFDRSSMRSIYHVREFDMFKLLQYPEPIDIMLSHDWPRGIYHMGDKATLLRKKKFFRQEVADNTLGSPPAEQLLHALQPRFWFSAHLHVKFAAVVNHPSSRVTRFLALDKCLPHREWCQVIDFPEGNGAKKLQFDPYWLAIVKSTNQFLSLTRSPIPLPHPNNSRGARFDFRPTEDELAFVRQRIKTTAKGSFNVPANFVRTAPAYVPQGRLNKEARQPGYVPNPQQEHLMSLLQLPDLIRAAFDRDYKLPAPVQAAPKAVRADVGSLYNMSRQFAQKGQENNGAKQVASATTIEVNNDEELDIGDLDDDDDDDDDDGDDEDGDDKTSSGAGKASAPAVAPNEEELDIGDVVGDDDDDE